MDDQRFDNLARALEAGTARRDVLKLLVGALTSGVAAKFPIFGGIEQAQALQGSVQYCSTSDLNRCVKLLNKYTKNYGKKCGPGFVDAVGILIGAVGKGGLSGTAISLALEGVKLADCSSRKASDELASILVTCGAEAGCDEGDICSSAICCPLGEPDLCNDTCVNLASGSDPNNCGACGVSCNPGPCRPTYCASGRCQGGSLADGTVCTAEGVEGICLSGECVQGCVPGGYCSTNDPTCCAEDERCLLVGADGQCVDQCTPGVACTSSSDCCVGQTCIEGECVADDGCADGTSCFLPGDCCEGQICLDEMCQTTCVAGRDCELDTDCLCQGYLVCVEGTCVESACTGGGPCLPETGCCAEGESCVGGSCQPQTQACSVVDPTCTTVSDVCSGTTNCYCRPDTEGTSFCGISVICEEVSICSTSDDCPPSSRCALATCCGRGPNHSCCPAVGGLCIPECVSAPMTAAAANGDGETSPPSDR